MIDHATYVRDSMRRRFGKRTREYAASGAAYHAAHAELLVSRAHLRPAEQVLDVATGPGGVALVAAAAVGPTGSVLATDLASEWAEVVEEAARRAKLSNLSFRAMGAEALDLPDELFDVVFCKLGLMYVPDPVQALREMRRVLRPGGRLGVMVWSSAERVAHHGIVQRALAPFASGHRADRHVPGPLELGEPGLIERYVAAAAFRDILVERHTLEYTYRDAADFCRRHLDSSAGPGGELLRALSREQRTQVQRDVVLQLAAYRREDRLCLPSEAIYVTAVR
jgi:SAM-dependent methyltransferase